MKNSANILFIFILFFSHILHGQDMRISENYETPRSDSKQTKNLSEQHKQEKLQLISSSEVDKDNKPSFESKKIFNDIDIGEQTIVKRDKTSIHLENSDGSITAYLFPGSLNYLENNQWKPIDINYKQNNTGKFTDFEFANVENSFHTFLSSQQENGIKTIIENNKISEWRDKKIVFMDENHNIIETIEASNGELDINDEKAIYKDIFPYTDAHITQLYDGRKIDYVINSPDFLDLIPDEAKYITVSESIQLPGGWSMEYFENSNCENSNSDRQQLSVFNETETEILRYMPPEYFEKEKNFQRRDIGVYEFEQNNNNLIVETVVPVNWLTDNDRQFPVVIDPTVNVYPDNATNWSRSVANDGWNYSGLFFGVDFDGYVSYWVRGSVKFNTSSIDGSSTVNSVEGNIYVLRFGGSNFENRPWQFSNSADPTTTSGLDLFNSMDLGYSDIVTAGTNTGWKNSTFYDPEGNQYVEDALENGHVNMGIVPAGTYNVGEYVELANHTSANRPYLTINYTPPGDPPSCTTPIKPSDGTSGYSTADILEWNSAPGADSYDVYFGTSSDPPFVTNTSNTSYNPSLDEETTYYWKIIPKNENGEATGCPTWSFTTGASPQEGDYRSRFMDGINRMWSNASNWEVVSGGTWVVASTPPNSNTVNVWIRDNSKMIINGNYEINNLNIEGLLQFYWGDGWDTAKTLTVNGDVVMSGDADFQTNAAGDAERNYVHLLILKGSIYNNANSGHGILFNHHPQAGWWSYVQVRFRGSGDAEWSGTGANDIGGLSILKDNPDDVVEIKPNQLLGWGSNDLDGNGFFMYDVIDHVGTLKIGGDYIMITRFGIQSTNTSADDPRILPHISSQNSGDNFTLIIDNPNFGISGGNTSCICYGNLEIRQGTINVGSGGNHFLEFTDGSSLTVSGGELTCAGPIAHLGSGDFDLNLSSGRIRAGYFGNHLSDQTGWFDIRNNANVNISGGEIHIINHSFTTSLNYPMYNVTTENTDITGGVLQFGSSVSPTGTSTYSLKGITPSIELYTNSSNIFSNAIMWDDVYCYGDLLIPENCSFSIYNQDSGDIPYTFSLTGDFIHEGGIYAEVEDSKIIFNGTETQTFLTTGTYSSLEGEAGISILEIDNTAGVNLTGNGTAVTKNLNKINGTFNLGDCFLDIHGNVTRTNGFLGGTENSYLSIFGSGETGNLFFDQDHNNLETIFMDRSSDGSAFIANDVNIFDQITFVDGILYTYENGNTSNPSSTILLDAEAHLISENNDSHIYGTVSISTSFNGNGGGSSGGELLGPEEFDSDILVHGSSAPTNVWFAPDSNTPIAHEPAGGCPGGTIGYEGNWNSWWGNFVRLPEIDCTGLDEVVMTFDVTHSHHNQTEDNWVRFYIWADGGYEHNVSSVTIDGTDVTYDSGANGKGFQFTESRTCAEVEVVFDISEISDKSDILFYIEASSQYNNSREFFVWFDNIAVSGSSGGGNGDIETPDFGNVWANMENVNDNLGNVTITRVTGVNGIREIEGVPSIECYWDIDVEHQPTENIDMEFKWLDIFDNSLPATADLDVFKKSGSDPWSLKPSTSMIADNPRIITTEASSFSEWTVSLDDEELPVTWLNFSGECFDDEILLKWQTATEVNNNYFSVQKSLDAIEFIKIGKIEGAGFSNTIKSYEFIDDDISDKTKYYRIKQVDFDGAYDYSKTISVNCDKHDASGELSVFPNPFDGKSFYINTNSKMSNLHISLYDITGRPIHSENIQNINGVKSIKLNNKLDKGVYIITIKNNKDVNVKKRLIVN